MPNYGQLANMEEAMCVNYKPLKRDELIEHFHVDVDAGASWPEETWKDYAAPVIRQSADGERETIIGTFGMVPKAHIPAGVRAFDTMNARAETVGEKRSFSKAWRTGQICLVPMWHFYEPNYEANLKKSERWAIKPTDHAPFAVAGLWREWRDLDGTVAFSFTQLTVNADEHPFMRRFHKPGAEKRSLVIVPQDEYDDWLGCRDPERARAFLALYPTDRMTGWPAPRNTGKNSSGNSM